METFTLSKRTAATGTGQSCLWRTDDESTRGGGAAPECPTGAALKRRFEQGVGCPEPPRLVHLAWWFHRRHLPASSVLPGASVTGGGNARGRRCDLSPYDALLMTLAMWLTPLFMAPDRTPPGPNTIAATVASTATTTIHSTISAPRSSRAASETRWTMRLLMSMLFPSLHCSFVGTGAANPSHRLTPASVVVGKKFRP